MFATRVQVSAGVLCVAGAIAGCGGGSGALSKAEFDKQANAICARGTAEVNAAGKRMFTSRPSQAQLVAFARSTVIPNIQSQISQVRKLKPPSGDRKTVDGILASAQAALDKVKANPALVAQNGPGPFAEADRRARAYGLTACASGGG
jgi:hypothetical protein